jgi:NADH dehydrogenase [ubiquinone] 1 alpha subcomplex assembly factor 5
MHLVNNLEACLLRKQEALKEDGVFIGTIFGNDTLEELRISFTLAELERISALS